MSKLAGRFRAFCGSTALQRPRQVSWVVTRRAEESYAATQIPHRSPSRPLHQVTTRGDKMRGDKMEGDKKPYGSSGRLLGITYPRFLRGRNAGR